MGVDSGYTTEFLDGPEAHLEAWNHFRRRHEQEHAHSSMHKSMNKSTDKGKAAMDKKRLEYYKKKLLARRGKGYESHKRTPEGGRSAGLEPRGGLAEHAVD